MKKFISNNPSQTNKIAGEFTDILRPGDIVGLQGDLAAGKTVFIKSVAKHLGIDPKEITSTSFILIKEHLTKDKTPFYHMDLYRLNLGQIPDEFYDIIYSKEGLVFIEWANRIDIPVNHFLIDIKMESLKRRIITIKTKNKKLQKRLNKLQE